MQATEARISQDQFARIVEASEEFERMGDMGPLSMAPFQAIQPMGQNSFLGLQEPLATKFSKDYV